MRGKGNRGRKEFKVAPRFQVWDDNRIITRLEKTGGAMGLGFSCMPPEIPGATSIMTSPKSTSFEVRD